MLLANQYEIDDWGIMRDFCYSVDDVNLEAELLDAIHGSGAFRHFKNTVYYRGMREDWLRFRQQALEQIATQWLGFCLCHSELPIPPRGGMGNSE